MPDLPERVWEWIVLVEGGYVDDPQDPGGRTIYGISERAHPEAWAAGTPDEAAARAIYARDYWAHYGCGDLPWWGGLGYFDALIQHRPPTAARLLQGAVGATQDGIVGPRTRAAVARCTIAYGWEEPAIRYLTARAVLYAQIVLADSGRERYLRGWLRRCFLLQSWMELKI